MRRPDPYPMMRHFSRPALAYPAIWRIVLVFIAVEIGFEAMPYVVDTSAHPADSPAATLLEFTAFILPCLALLLAMRLLHRRGLASLLGPAPAFRRDLRRVTLTVGLILLMQQTILIWADWDDFALIRDVGQWAVILPLGLAVLLLQVGTEELYFRGYLQQQLAAVNPSRGVWMVLPSIYFGLAHYMNGLSVGDGLVWTVWAGCLGLACADLTARTGNLGAAIGVHLANNIFALVITGYQDWPQSGLALFLYPADSYFLQYLDGEETLELLLSVFSILVMWLAARVAVRR